VARDASRTAAVPRLDLQGRPDDPFDVCPARRRPLAARPAAPEPFARWAGETAADTGLESTLFWRRLGRTFDVGDAVVVDTSARAGDNGIQSLQLPGSACAVASGSVGIGLGRKGVTVIAGPGGSGGWARPSLCSTMPWS